MKMFKTEKTILFNSKNFPKEEAIKTKNISKESKMKILSETKVNEVEKGGYIALDPMKKPDAIIISSGEELHASLRVAKRLKSKGILIRVVSMPNLERFLKQDKDYIDELLPVEIRKIVIEASSSFSWNKLIYNSKYLITLDEFGSSGKYKNVYHKYGFDVESLEEKVENLLK